MRFSWKDYDASFAKTAELWVDEDAKTLAGLDHGVEDYVSYWQRHPETRWNDNFFAKVLWENGAPFAFLALGYQSDTLYIAEFVVDPARRGQGLGAAVLQELLACGKEIIGREVHRAEAVIFPDNGPSRRAFAKAGFVHDAAEPDGDSWYYVRNHSL